MIESEPTINDNPNVKKILEREKEEYPFKLYVNLKSGKKAIVLSTNGGTVTVKYLITKHEVDYKSSYFDRTFNPVT